MQSRKWGLSGVEWIKIFIISFIIYIACVLILRSILDSPSVFIFFAHLYGYPTNQLFDGNKILNNTLYNEIHATIYQFTSSLSDWIVEGLFIVIFSIGIFIFHGNKAKEPERGAILLLVIVAFIVYLIWLLLAIIILLYEIRVSSSIFVFMGYFIMIGLYIVLYYLNPKYRKSNN